MAAPPETAGVTGRFAPSPTGALHVGSLATAVGSWLMARSRSGRWLVRMDDLDRARLVPGLADDILATLEDFGLLWDGPVTCQSGNVEAYATAFQRLLDQGAIYPCGCSRKEIAMTASAPHPEDDCVPYGGRCRTGMHGKEIIRSWRVEVPDEELCFMDLRLGQVCRNLAECGGDFVVRRGDGEFAYQLAVVIDDHLTGVNQVVRGEDLLASTPRQILLQRLLGLPQPEYCHLPLVTGPGGAKLSKRDNLVSHRLGNWKGREAELLVKVLRFHGLAAPRELAGAGCAEVLQWALTVFDGRFMTHHDYTATSFV